MRIAVETQTPARNTVDIFVLPLFQEQSTTKTLPSIISAIDRNLNKKIEHLIKSGDFKAKAGERLMLYPDAKTRTARVLLLGLGKKTEFNLRHLRRAAAEAVRAAEATPATKISFCIPSCSEISDADAGQSLAEGAVLASYRFDRYRSTRDESKERGKVTTVTFCGVEPKALRAFRSGVTVGKAIAESQNLARDLSNEPGGNLTPEDLARHAQEMSHEVGIACQVLDVPAMQERKMGGILAVGQGSANPPRVILLEYQGKAAASEKNKSQTSPPRTVCIVGKGITFDSGGISLKPGAAMDEMKHDMSGAAAVIGILRAAAALKLPLHLVGIIGAAENLPSGTAYRPGDIVTTMSGKTIEILNTDAEGRVVLADVLHLAHTDYKPELLIDLATLTGAVAISLGNWCSGVLGTDEKLIGDLIACGEKTGERLWQLPLWNEHKEAVKSPVADIKNTAGREGGTITAAAFLSNFVGKTPWAHLDIAATAWTTKDANAGQPRGATGVGVQLLIDFLRKK